MKGCGHTLATGESGIRTQGCPRSGGTAGFLSHHTPHSLTALPSLIPPSDSEHYFQALFLVLCAYRLPESSDLPVRKMLLFPVLCL